jgi:hypothetical protein
MTIAGLRQTLSRQQPALATFATLLAAAALLTPVWSAEPDRMSGLLLLAGVAAELTYSFRCRTASAQRNARASAGFTLLLALILLNTSWLAVTALAIFIAAPFALDALRHAGAAAREAAAGRPFQHEVIPFLWSLAAVAGVVLVGRFALQWLVAVAAAARLAGVTVSIATEPAFSEDDVDESVVADIGIDGGEQLAETAARLDATEKDRVSADRGWIVALLAVLFAIHVSRMGFDRSALGILSPLVAVVGDIAVALALAYFVIVPLRLFLRRATRGLERVAWRGVLAAPPRAGIAAWPWQAVRRWL